VTRITRPVPSGIDNAPMSQTVRTTLLFAAALVLPGGVLLLVPSIKKYLGSMFQKRNSQVVELP